MKKRNENANKGFSLVELIVVIAIMAVLIGVLAPQFLRYVEKSRLQKDNSAISEIANAMKVAMADETINNNTADGTTISSSAAANTAKTFTFTGGADGTVLAELEVVMGDTYTTTSNVYKTPATAIDMKIVKDTNGVVTVEVAGWVESVGGTATTAASPKVF